MPIPVVCPTCAARMTAPDRQSGRTVKCPKCQAAVPVPAAARPPRDDDPPRRDAADRYDEAGDYDDRPPGARSKKSAAPLLLVLGVVGLVGVGGLLVVAFLFVGWGGRPPVPPPVAVGGGGPVMAPRGPMQGPAAAMKGPARPDEWFDIEDDAFDFRAGFPYKAPAAHTPAAALDPNAPKDAPGKHLVVAAADGRQYLLSATPVRLRGTPARVYLRDLANHLAARHPTHTVTRGQDRTTSGHPSQDFVLMEGAKVQVVRIVVTPAFSYRLTVTGLLFQGDPWKSLDDPIVEEFFDSFEVIRATTVPAAKGKK